MSVFQSESFSDNLKSAIQNPQWLGLWVFTLMLISGAVAQAQQPVKGGRVGFLHSGSKSVRLPHLDVFRQEMREHGYIEGQNLTIEVRFARASSIVSLISPQNSSF